MAESFLRRPGDRRRRAAAERKKIEDEARRWPGVAGVRGALARPKTFFQRTFRPHRPRLRAARAHRFTVFEPSAHDLPWFCCGTRTHSIEHARRSNLTKPPPTPASPGTTVMGAAGGEAAGLDRDNQLFRRTPRDGGFSPPARRRRCALPRQCPCVPDRVAGPAGHGLPVQRHRPNRSDRRNWITPELGGRNPALQLLPP